MAKPIAIAIASESKKAPLSKTYTCLGIAKVGVGKYQAFQIETDGTEVSNFKMIDEPSDRMMAQERFKIEGIKRVLLAPVLDEEYK